MKILEFERRILRQLYYSSNGLIIFTIYQRLRLTPSQLYLFIDKFKKADFISYEDEKLELTANGRKEILEKELNTTNKKNKFASIPEDFLIPALNINEFYIPKLSETKSIFRHKEINGAGKAN